jgi:ketosteroid isomerase-like protein
VKQNSTDIVTDFYRAVSAKDAAALAATIDAHFADDAAIEWPPTLPHGGRIEGARKLRAVFAGIAKPDAPAGVTNLDLVCAVGDNADVAAWITFDWKHPGGALAPNSAVEMWRFDDAGKVTEIRAFYWDTDAIARPAVEAAE